MLDRIQFSRLILVLSFAAWAFLSCAPARLCAQAKPTAPDSRHGNPQPPPDQDPHAGHNHPPGQHHPAPSTPPGTPQPTRAGQPVPQTAHAAGHVTLPTAANVGIEAVQMQFSGPGIVFDTQTYDFGRVEAGPDIHHTYWFTNPGKETLKILAVRPGCGCTTAGEWDREVPPGGSGRIPVKIQTLKVPGKFTKTVSVTTNVTEAPNVTLQFSGEVWHPVDVQPSSVSFGVLNAQTAGDSLKREVYITNNTGQPLKIADVVTNSPMFRAEVTPIEEGQRFKLAVTALPPLRAGAVSASVSLSTNSAKSPKVDVPISAYVPPPLQLIPTQLALGPVSAVPVQRMATIRNNTGAPVEITNLKCTDEQIKLQLDPTSDKRTDYKLTINLPPNYVAPPAGVTITMDTNVAEAKTLSLRLVQTPPGRGHIARTVPGSPTRLQPGAPPSPPAGGSLSGGSGPQNPPPPQK